MSYVLCHTTGQNMSYVFNICLDDYTVAGFSVQVLPCVYLTGKRKGTHEERFDGSTHPEG